MAGFRNNVLGGILRFLSREYRIVMGIFGPVIDATAQALKQNAKADIAKVVVQVGTAYNQGARGQQLLDAAETALLAQGVSLGTAALNAFVAAVQQQFGGQ